MIANENAGGDLAVKTRVDDSARIKNVKTKDAPLNAYSNFRLQASSHMQFNWRARAY